ncbi:hypothetical protein CDAR_236611 [Caerostris darwini]|uniref:Uncharacterized protein n=1 Tax=Caerostris darwini TaxID=1538125 RepID=A0AAV4MPC1_9ARAC|nr:hypothetical protein CDAR_236611 [Caerostris darwini]
MRCTSLKAVVYTCYNRIRIGLPSASNLYFTPANLEEPLSGEKPYGKPEGSRVCKPKPVKTNKKIVEDFKVEKTEEFETEDLEMLWKGIH